MLSLSGRKSAANVVVENLGSRARQRAQPRLLQLEQKLAHRNAERLRAMADFERRERVNVNLRLGLLRRAADLQVGVPGEGGMDASLHAHLRAAPVPGFAHAALDFIEVDQIRRAPQVLVRSAFGERAEAALVQANVRVVDVADDGVTHRVADGRLSNLVGDSADAHEIGRRAR